MIIEQKLIDKINKLEKKDLDLIIADFDDTIFSTKLLLDNDYRKWRRWDEWNKYLLENNLIPKVIKEVYTNQSFPQTIIKKLKLNHDLILTAWIKEFSEPKLNATWVNIYNYIIVEKAEDKILESIKYVIYKLKYIPKSIIIYEDRPLHFIKHKKILENTLWINVIIKKVSMQWNDKEPIIEDIK